MLLRSLYSISAKMTNRALYDDANDVEGQKLLLPAPQTTAVPAANNLMPIDAAVGMVRSPSSRFEVQRVLDDTLRPVAAATAAGGGSISARNTPQLSRANHFNIGRRASEAASPNHVAKVVTTRIVTHENDAVADDNGITADHDTFTLDTLEAMPHETNYALTHMLGGDKKSRPTLEALQGAMLAYDQQQQLLLNGLLDRAEMGAHFHHDDSNSEPSSLTYGGSTENLPGKYGGGAAFACQPEDGISTCGYANTVAGANATTAGASAPTGGSAVGARFGWIKGVLIRCLLNIWGVMLFLRLSWITGQAGILLAIVIVVLATLTTLLTALSMSAICTNGVVRGGGTYYMISRSLGPEFGGAIGLIFSLANAVAVAMYTVGFAETVEELLVAADMQIIRGHPLHDIRIIGCGTVFVLFGIAMLGGMQWEARAQVVLLFILLTALANFIVGTFIPPSDEEYAQGFTGYSLRTFSDNLMPNFRDKHTFMSVFAIFFPAATGILAGANISGDLKDPQTSLPKGTLLAIGITSATYIGVAVLIGATMVRDASGVVPAYIASNATLRAEWYPSCSSSAAFVESNNITELISSTLSSALDAAVSSVTVNYAVENTEFSPVSGNHSDSLSAVPFDSRCKFGIINSVRAMELASGFGPLIIVGIFAATLSSALASLVSAPKVFQAVCIDRLFPYIHVFGVGSGKNREPIRAYLLTFVIALLCVLIGELNLIAPIISNFFLAAYALVNYACFDATLSDSPGFRPRFKYFNLWTAGAGTLLCMAVMFLMDWLTALITFVIVGALWLYVHHVSRPNVNWGSSLEANMYRRALLNTLKVTRSEDHVKNYRPQVLVLSGYPANRPALVDLVSAFTEDRSLMLCGHVLLTEHTLRMRQNIARQAYAWLNKRHIKSFYTQMTSTSLREGARSILQVAGVGKLRPNICIMGYLNRWLPPPANVPSSSSDDGNDDEHDVDAEEINLRFEEHSDHFDNIDDGGIEMVSFTTDNITTTRNNPKLSQNSSVLPPPVSILRSVSQNSTSMHKVSVVKTHKHAGHTAAAAAATNAIATAADVRDYVNIIGDAFNCNMGVGILRLNKNYYGGYADFADQLTADLDRFNFHAAKKASDGINKVVVDKMKIKTSKTSAVTGVHHAASSSTIANNNNSHNNNNNSARFSSPPPQQRNVTKNVSYATNRTNGNMPKNLTKTDISSTMGGAGGEDALPQGTPMTPDEQLLLDRMVKRDTFDRRLKKQQSIAYSLPPMHRKEVHVWWLYDDGGLTILVPHLIAQRWKFKLRAFYLTSSSSTSAAATAAAAANSTDADDAARKASSGVAESQPRPPPPSRLNAKNNHHQRHLDATQRKKISLLNKFRIQVEQVTPVSIARPSDDEASAMLSKVTRRMGPYYAGSSNTTQQQNPQNAENSAARSEAAFEAADIGDSDVVSEHELQANRDRLLRELKLRELLCQHSSDAALIVVSLPMFRRNMTPALYMSMLDCITGAVDADHCAVNEVGNNQEQNMPPMLLLRGNQQSVLTFYM